MNVCIVGLGRAGRFHLHSIQQIDGVELKYVVDPGLEQGDISGDYKLLTDIEAALQDEDLDAVIVSCPTGFHYDYITRSLQAGKHVFAEKPLGKTVNEIRTCYRLAAGQRRALYLGFQRRYDQNFQTLKAQIPALGQIRTIKTSSRDNPKPSLDYLRISGNIFHDMLIHDFDMLLFLLGTYTPKSVFAHGHAYD
ncbi:MAG: Gfo/Idh/MocA family oxidoreductase [Bacteroidota bacterium]